MDVCCRSSLGWRTSLTRADYTWILWRAHWSWWTPLWCWLHVPAKTTTFRLNMTWSMQSLYCKLLNYQKLSHCTLISFTILIPASQPVWPAGRFSTLWPAGRFRVIWPAGRFRKIWPAAGFCSKRSASVHTLHMSKTCDDVRVQSATDWTASVHTLHMSRPVMTFVFRVLRNGLLRYIRYTCPNLM